MSFDFDDCCNDHEDDCFHDNDDWSCQQQPQKRKKSQHHQRNNNFRPQKFCCPPNVIRCCEYGCGGNNWEGREGCRGGEGYRGCGWGAGKGIFDFIVFMLLIFGIVLIFLLFFRLLNKTATGVVGPNPT